MGNPQLDQFMHTLWWKAVPPIILAAIGVTLLREFLQWVERRTAKFVRDRRGPEANNGLDRVSPHRLSEGRGAEVPPTLTEAPHCPSCNSQMVKRVAKRGSNPGSVFWGCQNYPKCKGTRSFAAG